MNKTVLFLLLLMIAVSSCERRQERRMQTTVSGKVIDMETQAPLPGATVYFLKQQQGNASVNINFHQLTTDANGQFTYTFTAEEGYNYYTYGTYQNYLMNGFVYTTVGQTNNINILLSQPGFMAIHVQNTSPVDSTDQIVIYDSDYWFPEHTFTGTAIDTTIIIQHYGNRTNQVKWRVTKNDTTISYNQSFNFISQDTLSFDLFY